MRRRGKVIVFSVCSLLHHVDVIVTRARIHPQKLQHVGDAVSASALLHFHMH